MITDTYPTISLILIEAKQKILELANNENKSMIDKIIFQLNQNINSLSVFTGNVPEANSTKTIVGQPLKTIMGKKVFGIKQVEKPIPLNLKQKMAGLDRDRSQRLQTQEELEFLSIEKERDALYDVFLLTDTDGILDSYSDLLIRGVAKKAGLPVTDNLPAKVNKEFVEQIKDALKKKDIKSVDNKEVSPKVEEVLLDTKTEKNQDNNKILPPL